MPLTMNVGLSRKVGEANYGSRGASVNFEVELEASLVREPDQLRERVRYLFSLAQEAVEEELSGHSQHQNNKPIHNGNGNSSFQASNGHRAEVSGSSHLGNGQRASQKQSDYIYQLAKQIKGLGVRRLEGLAEKMFGKPLTELTSMDASGLIDTIKEIKEGTISLDDALQGVAA